VRTCGWELRHQRVLYCGLWYLKNEIIFVPLGIPSDLCTHISLITFRRKFRDVVLLPYDTIQLDVNHMVMVSALQLDGTFISMQLYKFKRNLARSIPTLYPFCLFRTLFPTSTYNVLVVKNE